jgi:hypothetical protein
VLVPRPVTVWAVELGRDVPSEEVRGTLELEREALLFTPRDETLPSIRIPFASVHKVRRLRGSPILMVQRSTEHGERRTAFYFAQPPPLNALLGATPDRPMGLAAFRSPKRKARRDNVGYLGLMNREKKATLTEWVRALKAAIANGGPGPGQATARG